MKWAEFRKQRLAAAYNDMRKFDGQQYLKWEGTKGEAPFFEEYLLTINARMYCGEEKTMDSCQIRVSFSQAFPKQAPEVKMISKPLVYHPYWFSDGTYDPGKWRTGVSFQDYVKQMIMSLLYDSSMINSYDESAPNLEAMEWYRINRLDSELFPSDQQTHLSIIHEMELTFVNQDGSTLTAELSAGMTADEAIAELIEESFIPEPPDMCNWELFSPGMNRLLSGDQPLCCTGLVNGETVKIIMVTPV